ncbi:MAG: hypothetical protein ACR2FY_18585 [Pirellulaceae bacterium]
MKTLEFEATIAHDRTLTVPSLIAAQIAENTPVRIVLFVPDEQEEQVAWSRTTASEFLKGYAESDSIYDHL